MGFWQPVTNLRDYVSHNPPGVTFFLCLLTVAVSFICLSAYSYTHTLPNPDTAEDWNHLLSSLSQFQLCVKANVSSPELVSPVPPSLGDGDPTVNSTETPSLGTLRVKVPLALNTNSNSVSLKDLGLHATFRARQLHLGDDEIVNVTLEFLSENETCTCLTITAPTHLLPMSLLPPECPVFEKHISPILTEAGDHPHAASQTCYSLHSTNDPTLAVMLTQEEQSVAVRHLLGVSVCLLGVCLILCVAASITHSLNRRYHSTGMEPQNVKEPLIDP
ncbi:transmembrane protein 248 isoform X1 [Gasterosteus aculeatus]